MYVSALVYGWMQKFLNEPGHFKAECVEADVYVSAFVMDKCLNEPPSSLANTKVRCQWGIISDGDVPLW